MADVANDRAAVDRRQVGVEHGQAVPVEQHLDGLQRVVQQVLVVDLVEGQVLHDAFHVQELHHEHTVGFEALLDGAADRMQLFQVKEHARGVEHIELLADGRHRGFVEELVQRGHTGFVGHARRGLRRLHPQDLVAQRLKVLELRAVVRADVQHRLVRLPSEEPGIDLRGDVAEVFGQRLGHTRQIGVIAEHDFLFDREIQLGGVAVVAVQDPERIKGLSAHFVRFQEVVAPRLLAKIDDQFELQGITHTASHALRFLQITQS